MPLKLAPSPPVTSSIPSLSKASAPPAWLGNCWHHSPRAAVADQVQPAGRIRDVRGQVDRVAVELAADDAAVGRAPGRTGAVVVPLGVVPDRRGLPGWRVVHVVHVDVVAPIEEVGIERDAQQAAVPVVVDVGADIEDLRRRGVVDGVVLLDDPALLRDERLAIGANRIVVGQVSPVNTGTSAKWGSVNDPAAETAAGWMICATGATTTEAAARKPAMATRRARETEDPRDECVKERAP